jgi:hypothetical protein
VAGVRLGLAEPYRKSVSGKHHGSASAAFGDLERFAFGWRRSEGKGFGCDSDDDNRLKKIRIQVKLAQ